MTDTSIRINVETKNLLDHIKPEFEYKYPKTFISYNFLIHQLLYSYDKLNELTDPEIIEEQKRELLKDYIHRKHYDELVNEKIQLQNNHNQLVKEHEDLQKTVEIQSEKAKENLNLEKLKNQKQLDFLNRGLSNKKKEISLLKQKNNESLEKIMNLEPSLKDFQDKFDKCNLEYNNLKDFVDKECITKKSLEIMYYISWFLSRPLHKRLMYSILGLQKGLLRINRFFIYEDIQEALTLTNYKIFPVRHDQQDGVDYFYFDKKYLR